MTATPGTEPEPYQVHAGVQSYFIQYMPSEKQVFVLIVECSSPMHTLV